MKTSCYYKNLYNFYFYVSSKQFKYVKISINNPYFAILIQYMLNKDLLPKSRTCNRGLVYGIKNSLFLRFSPLVFPNFRRRKKSIAVSLEIKLII